MPPKTTLWPLDDHTLGKHMVLRAYMVAWLPIILSTFAYKSGPPPDSRA